MSFRRPWLAPLIPLYRLGLGSKNLLTNLHLQPLRTLAQPVLSVGSLSSGGAGKTPVVLALAQLLTRHGANVDVLSRGYGRASADIAQVDPAGDTATFGDEPLLLAQAGLTVFVGADRYAAGQFAEQRLGQRDGHFAEHVIARRTTSLPTVHLLDDGFQHRRLARSLDLVLLTAEDAADHLLPGGNLREPLSALARANAILLREDEAAALTPLARAQSRAPIWLIRRTLTVPATRPRRPIAFAGIARPHSFFADLTNAGCTLAGTHSFPDHHAYTAADIAMLLAAAARVQADGFFTTAKDAVKITPAWAALLAQAGPLVVAPLEVDFLDPAQVIAHLLEAIPGLRRGDPPHA